MLSKAGADPGHSSFQAYTSCTVLLHAVVQRQIHGLPSSAWQMDQGHVDSCLSVLEFCSSMDPVAARFHQLLNGIAEEIFQQVSSEGSERSQPPDTARGPGCDEAVPYPLEIPASANPKQLKLSLHLLGMLSQPFGDPSTRCWTDPNMKRDLIAIPTPHDYLPQVAGQMDWDVNSRDAFSWDPNQLALPFEFVGFSRSATQGEVPHPPRVDSQDLLIPVSLANSFVGSNAPSGWTSVTDVVLDKNQQIC